MSGAYGDSKPDHESRDDTERRIEETYSFNREEDVDLTVLAIVSRDQDELAEQFFEWLRNNPFAGKTQDGLLRWEAIMFGRQLEAAGHGMLWFAVRRKLAPNHTEQPREPKRPMLSPAERQRRFDEAMGKRMREAEWPGPDEAHAQRVREQAQAMREG